MKQNTKPGFTLIELLVVTFVIATIASVSVANFRAGQRQKQVSIGVDTITNAFRNAQNFALNGKKTNNSNSACRTPQFGYSVHFTYAGVFTLNGLNNCSTTDAIESYTLPAGTRVTPGNGIKINGIVTSDASFDLVFVPPFGQMKVSGNVTSTTGFTTLTISVELTDGTSVRTVTIDGVAGRIGQ